MPCNGEPVPLWANYPGACKQGVLWYDIHWIEKTH